MSDRRHVVIVGGGIAGWTVATSLRDLGFAGDISVVESEPVCYDRPPLSKQVLLRDTGLEALTFADSTELLSKRIRVRHGQHAVSISPDEASVTLAHGEVIPADVVVVATGAQARRPQFAGAHLPGVLTLRTYSDALALKAFAGRPIAVVGAGLIGAEATSALRTLGSPVTLIDPNEIAGTRVFGRTMATHLHAMHAAAGVDVRVDTVSQITAHDDALRVSLESGDSIDVGGVLMATGISVDSTLARSAGIKFDGAIVTDEAGRTSHSRVFAVGDAAARRGTKGATERPKGHWEAAQLDGRTVAAAIVGDTPAPRGSDWFWSDRYGHHVEVVGRFDTQGDEVIREGAHPTVFFVRGSQLLGAVSIDDPMAVRAARRLIDRSVPVTTDQLADPSVPLRSLLPRR